MPCERCRLWRWAGLAAANLAVLVLLMLSVNFLAALLIDGYDFLGLLRSGGDRRGESAAYQDRAFAEAYYAELAAAAPVVYEPYTVWRRKAFAGRYITVDDQGHRRHPADPADQGVEPAREIGVFGGSTIWGTGAEDARTIPALLDYALPGVRVHNFGEGGYNSRQNIDNLLNLLTEGRTFDAVVFYDGVNDVYTFCRTGEPLVSHGQVGRLRELTETAASYHTVDVLLAQTQEVIRRLIRRAGGTSGTSFDCHDNPEKAERVADLILHNWRQGHSIAQANGMRFMAVLQPVAYVGQARVDHMDAYQPLTEIVGEQYRAVYPHLSRKISAAAVPWALDLSDAFDGADPLYVDFAHVTGAGNQRIADRLAPTLTRLLSR